jgi:MtN3 and saliva related transmembrane protein
MPRGNQPIPLTFRRSRRLRSVRSRRFRPQGVPPLTEVTVVSVFAAVLSMISFVPQAWQIIKSKNTKKVSTKMYVVVVAGFMTWLAYGIMTMQWAIIGQNLVCLLISCFILWMKIVSPARTKAVADKLDPSVNA